MNPLIIDAHMHMDDDMEGLSMLCECRGTPEEFLGMMDRYGIDGTVIATVCSAGNGHDRVGGTDRKRYASDVWDEISRRNEQNCRIARKLPNSRAFVTVHPDMGEEGMVSEITEKKERYGASGIKLHPGVGRYFPDDRDLWPVYKTAVRLNLPLLSHGGLCTADRPYTAPERFKKVLASFHGLTLIIAHLGFPYLEETLALAKAFPHALFDVSGGLYPDPDVFINLIRKIGIHRVLFGSDYPWYHPGHAVKWVQALGLTDKEKEFVLGLNAVKILGIEHQ